MVVYVVMFSVTGGNASPVAVADCFDVASDYCQSRNGVDVIGVYYVERVPRVIGEKGGRVDDTGEGVVHDTDGIGA